jgi:hypothetical protein
LAGIRKQSRSELCTNCARIVGFHSIGVSQGRGDFEDAVVVFRGELARIHTFWQLNRSLDASISELLLQILALLFLSLAFILTFHCEAIALKAELDLFGVHARRHSDAQVIFLFFSVNPSLNRRHGNEHLCLTFG